MTDGVNSGDGQITISYAAADLSLTNTVAPTAVVSGHELTDTLITTNTGGQDATNTTVTDTLPASAQIDGITPSQGFCTDAGGVVTCNLGTLSGGSVATITILATPTAPGTLSATANVTADDVTPDADDSATATVTVTAPPPPPATTTTTPTTTPTPAAAPAQPPAQPAAAPATPPLRISAIGLSAPTVTWCRHCTYPNTKLNFNLSTRTDIRLQLMARIRGHFKQVAVTTLHAHKGHNSFRVAGRWHGQLVPGRTTHILVQIEDGVTWTTTKTLTLTVHSPYTTRILNHH